MRKVAVPAWTVLVAIVLFVHGAVPHGHHSRIPVFSLQAWHSAAEPADRSLPDPGVRSDPVHDGCPEPWEHCYAGVRRAVTPLSRHAGQPPRGGADAPGPALAGMPWAVTVMRHTQGTRLDERPVRAELQIFRC
jgi:hypothetical protein